ncbi:MAG: hypothetical protein AYK22_09230 [Thermoplasmatales archaeon SG8-52-3]|nr:MAG: hypothetical protein AYK22_09230 [Thermoplasmatales archaeon SG8-52-3]
MNNKKLTFFILLTLFSIILTTGIEAFSITNNNYEFTRSHGEKNSNVSLINNGIVFGRTIMAINSNPCGPLEFVNITFKGEETIKIKSGLFGFFIVKIPIGKYFVAASKYGFYDAYTYVMLFRFKPFAIITLILDKRGWN